MTNIAFAVVPACARLFCGWMVLAASAEPAMLKGRRGAGIWKEGVLPANAPVNAVGWPGTSSEHPAVNTNLGAGVVAMAHGSVVHFWDTLEDLPAAKDLGVVYYMEPEEYAPLPPHLPPLTPAHPRTTLNTRVKPAPLVSYPIPVLA